MCSIQSFGVDAQHGIHHLGVLRDALAHLRQRMDDVRPPRHGQSISIRQQGVDPRQRRDRLAAGGCDGGGGGDFVGDLDGSSSGVLGGEVGFPFISTCVFCR